MTIRRFLCVLALCALGAGTLFVVTRATTAAQPVTPIGHRAPFAHVIIVVQENRTPDNLFYALCTHRPLSVEPRCSASPGPAQYEIQPAGWHDKTAPDKAVDPKPIPLANWYDLGHSHGSFTTACDASTGSTDCRMDGSAGVSCRPAKGHPCPDRPQFRYVDNSTGTIEPYIQMALQYGWANRMFQANQGPSYPAHQFLFGGTSAPTGPDDGRGVFVSENLVGTGAVGGFNKPAGCASPARTRTTVLHPDGSTTRIYPCFRHRALPDVFPANVSWRYYVPSNGSIWTAPNSLAHMCRPNGHHAGSKCVGPIYTQHVVIPPTQVRTDIAKCALQSVSWVIPAGPYSDHAGPRAGDGGPRWVASIVNDIGKSQCGYWRDTAIIVTWDDWGGWYDHVPPPFYQGAQGDYQYGFRVPLVVVSAYTPQGYINNATHDFGSILRFVEHNFGIAEGALGFDDSRASTDLRAFFSLASPRAFVPIPALPLRTEHARSVEEPDDG